jgi:tocopherol O-methyltransferase
MSTQLSRVTDYFARTKLDYELFWTGNRDQALHHGYYDAMTTSHSAALIRMNEVLAGYAAIRPHDRVLDAGSGYGGSAVWLAQNVGCSVVGINLVPFQTERACRLAAQSGVDGRAQFVLADYSHVPFGERSFDVVWGLESIVHAESREKFIEEAARVLRPGGRLLVAEYTARESPPLSEHEERLIASGLDGWAMTTLLTPCKYSELLLRHGFGDVRAHDLTEAMRRSITHLGKLRVPTTSVRLLLPVLEVLTAAQLTDKVRLRNIRGGYDFTLAFLVGAWRYTAVVGTKQENSRGSEDTLVRTAVSAG